MFEVGKTYVFHEVEPKGGTGYHAATVLEWSPPLLKISHPGLGFEILNVNSMMFHKAEASQHETYDTPAKPAKKPARRASAMMT